MLIHARCMEEIDGRKLMDLYREGNEENIDYFYPGAEDRAAALVKIEEDFLEYLREDFLGRRKGCYYILEREGTWVSALRLYDVWEGVFYLEALETHPAYRRKGYACELLDSLLEELKKGGAFKICDNVGRKNEASLATHRKCGFSIVRDPGYDYLRQTEEEGTYGLAYLHQ